MIPTSRLGTCLVSQPLAMGTTLCYLINVWNAIHLENTHHVTSEAKGGVASTK